MPTPISVNGENGTLENADVKTVEYVRVHASNVRMLILLSVSAEAAAVYHCGR